MKNKLSVLGFPFHYPARWALPFFVFFLALFMCSRPLDVIPSSKKTSHFYYSLLWGCISVPCLVCICTRHATLMHKLDEVQSAHSIMNISGNILQQLCLLPCLMPSPESIFNSAKNVCVVHKPFFVQLLLWCHKSSLRKGVDHLNYYIFQHMLLHNGYQQQNWIFSVNSAHTIKKK